MTALRAYQTEVIQRVDQAIGAGQRRLILVAPTGSGKTVIAAEIIKSAVAADQRVLFLAHRRELIHQASEKLFAHGVDAGVVLADHPTRPEQSVQVASVQTLWARAMRTRTMDLPPADMVVVDEAHHARARTYTKIIAAYPNAVILGLTATPVRGDGRGLGNVFDTMIQCPQVQQLIDGGYLVSTKVFAPTVPDLKGVRVERGDYVEGQLAARMDTTRLVGDIVSHWHRLAERRPTVVFAVNVAHSIHIRDEFLKSGVKAEHIDASTPKLERDAIIAKLARGEVELVANCMVLTEGWDSPAASCAVLARPTKHLGLYLQMVGRVLRPAPGKSLALVIDHAGAVFQHGFAEDPISWTLDVDKRAENKAHAARHAFGNSRLTTCPKCSAIRIGGEACRVCGWEPARRAQAVDFEEGDLGRVDRRRHAHRLIDTPEERTRWHRELAGIARDHNYQRGWVAHKFKERFGVWPPWGEVEPATPSPEVSSWVRSRNIAYAKARTRERVA